MNTLRTKVIQDIADHERMTVAQIASAIDKPASCLYDIQKGKIKGVSEKLASLILEKFPHYNKSWLLTGEGEMLKPTQSIEGDGNIQVGGNACNVNAGKTIDKLIGLLSKAQEQISKRDEQIDNLIAVVERLTAKLGC